MRKLGAIALIALSLFYLFTYILSMFLGISVFFFTTEGSEVTNQFIRGLLLYLFFDFSVLIPTPLNIGVLFIALWAIFWIAIIVAWSGPAQSYPKTIRMALSSNLRDLHKNYLTAFPIITSMLIVVEILLQAFQESVGIPIGSVNIPNQYMLFLQPHMLP